MKKLIFILSLLISTQVFGDWTPTGESDKYYGFIDTSTVKRNGNLVRYWEMLSYKEPLYGSKGKYQTFMGLTEFDCREERSRILSLTTYSEPMGKGQVVSSDKPSGEWSYITPGSQSSYMFGVMCKKK